jgi:methylated-DNA-[protein]-cysteine S-methyltransferase
MAARSTASNNGEVRGRVMDSPIGELSLAVDEVGVCAVSFGRRDVQPADDPRLDAAVAQLASYFAGELTEFELPLSVRRGSDFDRAVWIELARIPYGQMRTYGEIATAVGDASAARAVGVACNRNPLPLVVPCHRVVGAGGKLVGFGGGLPRKRFLLELEARVAMQRAWGMPR